MSKRIRVPVLCVFLFLMFLLPALACPARADTLPGKYADALKYVQKNQPMEATAENVRWNPTCRKEECSTSPAAGTAFPFRMKAKHWT